uniref:FUN14 domain-containing protein 2 n=1 Tax=Peromyscus maniculatus bairdii TaxID=230844 RepID=A0A8C8TUR5_PERMB
MARTSQGNFDGKFEALDLCMLFGQESGPSAEKYSVATQLLIGGITGWVSLCIGFIFQKVGKLAATAVGGGFFLLQLANHTGFLKVDWQRVEKDMKKAKEHLKIHKNNQISTEVKSKAEEVVSFVKKNVLVTGGFFGRLSAWHGTLRNTTSFYCFFFSSCQQLLHSNIGQSTLLFLLFLLCLPP